MQRNGISEPTVRRILAVYGRQVRYHVSQKASADERANSADEVPYPAFWLREFNMVLSLHTDLPDFIDKAPVGMNVLKPQYV